MSDASLTSKPMAQVLLVRELGVMAHGLASVADDGDEHSEVKLLKADEYHPYAACLMFKSCHDSETVRANLRGVILHGRDLEIQSRVARGKRA